MNEPSPANAASQSRWPSHPEEIGTGWVALILCVVMLFTGIVDREISTPDEPRVAAISLEMSRTGEFVVPHLAGEPFVEKPPLYYAVGAAFVRVLGRFFGYAGAIRLSSAAWGLGALAATLLLGVRLKGWSFGLGASILLATMHGFVNESHWIRVDIALVFFVVAAVYAFGEVYLGGRKWFYAAAGLLAGGAFLTKGLVGPAWIATGWAGLGLPWFVRRWRGRPCDFYLLPALAGVVAFALPSALWLSLFRAKGGAELWDQWFWANQVGRATGTATGLGHVRGGGLLPYLEAIAAFTLPWLPALGVWVALLVRDVRARTLSPHRLFVLTWVALGLLMLSLSASKRSLYLLPLLPALALACADVLYDRALPRWLTGCLWAYGLLSVLALGGLTLSPLLAPLFSSVLPAESLATLQAVSLRHLFCGLACGLAVILLVRNRSSFSVSRIVSTTALAHIGFYLVVSPAMDAALGLRARLGAFVHNVPPAQRDLLAGYALTESAVGYLYCHGDWALKRIVGEEQAAAVLEGRDPRFQGLIINPALTPSRLLDIPHRVLAECLPEVHGRRRSYQWVEGTGPP